MNEYTYTTLKLVPKLKNAAARFHVKWRLCLFRAGVKM